MGPEVIEFDAPVAYEKSINTMLQAHDDVLTGKGPEKIFLLEHQDVITKGLSAKESELLNPTIPVIATNRGGKYTYHGPGQLVCYPIINLKARAIDIHSFVTSIERLIIETLAAIGIEAFVKKDFIGVWVSTKDGDKKIAAIGLKVKRFISTHGFSINVCPNLDYFSQIIPCGIKEYGVTSLEDLGIDIGAVTIRQILKKNLHILFGENYP